MNKPQRIAYYTDSTGFGGAEKALLQLMGGLDRRKWQPVLLHTGSPGITPLLQAARRLEIASYQAPAMPLGLVGAVRMLKLISLLNTLRPVVFHANLTWPLDCKWALAGASLSRVPAILVTEHLYVESSYTRLAVIQQRLLARRVGRYIAVSNSVARRLQGTFGLASKMFLVIPNAIPDQIDDPIPAQADEFKHPLVLTVARLDAQKGLCYLLEAAARLPEVSFALAGDGPLRSALERQAAALGIQDRVHFLGFRSDIQTLLSVADLFVLPSLYEGMPLALLEAMAAGRAVIATDIPGVNELIKPGETGCLVPPADPGRLAVEIRSLLSDTPRAARMGESARAYVESEYSQSKMVNRVCAVYDELLIGKSPS